MQRVGKRCYGVGSRRSGKTRKVVRWEEKERGVMECGGEEWRRGV